MCAHAERRRVQPVSMITGLGIGNQGGMWGGQCVARTRLEEF